MNPILLKVLAQKTVSFTDSQTRYWTQTHQHTHLTNKDSVLLRCLVLFIKFTRAHVWWQGWLNHRPSSENETIMKLFEGSFPGTLPFRRSELEVPDASSGGVHHQAGMRPAARTHPGQPFRAGDTTISNDHYERLYIFALMWSIGAFLELEHRHRLDAFLRNHQTIKLNLPILPENSDYSMFDYMVETTGQSVSNVQLLIPSIFCVVFSFIFI